MRWALEPDQAGFTHDALAFAAAALVALWGIAHAVPTRQVVAGFGPISADSRRVILQEWLAEAFTMWGLAGVVVAATLIGPSSTDIVHGVYFAVAGLLVALAALTGARTPVVWFKICPALLSVSAALLVAAAL